VIVPPSTLKASQSMCCNGSDKRARPRFGYRRPADFVKTLSVLSGMSTLDTPGTQSYHPPTTTFLIQKRRR
jgi:hypothetical protein